MAMELKADEPFMASRGERERGREREKEGYMYVCVQVGSDWKEEVTDDVESLGVASRRRDKWGRAGEREKERERVRKPKLF